jgi:hypothetical protein
MTYIDKQKRDNNMQCYPHPNTENYQRLPVQSLLAGLTDHEADGVRRMLIGYYSAMCETAARMPVGKERDIAALEALAFLWGLEPVFGPASIPLHADIMGRMNLGDVLKLGQRLWAALEKMREFWQDRPADAVRAIAEIEWRVRAGAVEALAYHFLAHG